MPETQHQRATQQPVTKELWGQGAPKALARHGVPDAVPPDGALQRVADRHGQQSSGRIAASPLDQPSQIIAVQARSRGVVHQHQVAVTGVARQALERVRDRQLPSRTADAAHHACVARFRQSGEPPVARRDRYDDSTDRALREQRTHGPGEHGPAMHLEILLGCSCAESFAAPGRQQDGPAARRSGHRASACAVRCGVWAAGALDASGGTT